ncbi:MAG: TonB-dependent receptor [Chitinophagaceae bacterium]|nr:TonB-dependent receptor [Chitinophagaceae bacterium]
MKSFLTVIARPLSTKVLLAMKLTALLTIFFALNVSANSFGQDKISLKAKKPKSAAFCESSKSRPVTDSFTTTIYRTSGKKLPWTYAMQNSQRCWMCYSNKRGYCTSQWAITSSLLKKNPSAIERVDVIVRGKVIGEGGMPLAGASVMVKNSTIGTTTNNEGNFSFSVPDANVTLVISSIGYDEQEIALNGRAEINVQLTMSTKVMDQVVVIGYGTAAKRDLTGSIVKVDGRDVADKPNTNPVASLQGRVAGLSVVNNGTPGRAPDIRIRGTSSIGSVSPLYIVDGIFQDNIDYINPNDIESLEILKDPSSLAIFGVRGASGVIAVTTKKAKAGQVIVNFNTTYGTKRLVDKIQMANRAEFETLFAEERANNGVTDPYDYTGLDADTDWIDAVTRTGKFNANNLSISGSSEKNKFNLGIGYISDEGIIRHEKLQKWLISFNDELRINRNIKVGINFNASRQNNPYDATWVLDAARKVIPHVSAGTRNFYVKNPYGVDSLNMDIYSALDVGLQSSGVINPLVQLENEWDKTINIEYRTVGSVFAEVTFLKNFTARSTVYADISNVNRRTYTPLYYAYNPRTNEPFLYNQTTRVSEGDQNWRKFQQDHVLTYKNNFGDHNVTATAGFTTFYNGYRGRFGNSAQYPSSAGGLPIPDDERFWYVSNGFQDPTNTSSSSDQNEYATVSVLARALYNYKNKYFLNASFRNDASSRLPSHTRNQQFWAVGLAWELSREAFMDGFEQINYLKLKTSAGVLGNQTASFDNGAPIDYPYYPLLQGGQSAVFGTNVYNAARPLFLPSPDLKWETITAYEVGVEAAAFNNSLTLELNYFNRTTKNLMTYVDRSQIGLDNQLINGGRILNRGVEIMTSYRKELSDGLSLTVGGNITFLKNKVLELSDALPTGILSRAFMNNGTAESRTVPGHPIGSFYGYIVNGVYQSYADILNSPVASSLGAYRPGVLKFADINGPDKMGPDGRITSDDRTFIGNPTPDFTYGGYVNLAYKGFSLGIDFNGVYGNEIFRTWGSLESPFQRVNYPKEKLGRWHGAGTSNWVPLVSQGDRFNYNGSTYNIEDGSYFRLRNIQLAYNFQRHILQKLKMRDLRIFANIQNLKTWKNNIGYTPEFGGDATAFGYDHGGGAIPAVTTFGLNVTF